MCLQRNGSEVPTQVLVQETENGRKAKFTTSFGVPEISSHESRSDGATERVRNSR